MSSTNGSVQGLDQRNFTLFVDPNHQEILGRAKAGSEQWFRSVRAAVFGWRKTGERLSRALEEGKPENGNYRTKKDSYHCFVITPDGKHERKEVGVFTVIRAAQIPSYVARFRDGCDEIVDWLDGMDRRFIGQDGKSRKEMNEAFQATSGRVLPSEMGSNTTINIPGQNGKPAPKGDRRPLFAPLRPPM